MKEKNKKKVSEASAMAAGAVAGAPSGQHLIDREEFLEELKLRESIRKLIPLFQQQELSESLEEHTLRRVIRSIISEKKSLTTPYSSTAINFLEELLKEILPRIEQDYKSLTSKREQRDSFRSHLVSSIEASMSTLDLNMAAAAFKNGDQEASRFIDIDEDIEENIEIDISDEDREKFIDIDKDEDKERDEEAIARELQLDTGSKLAAQTFDSIETQILQSYSTLSDEEDQKTFEDYMVTNLKLYFDKWENELSDVIEPTTSEYEEEKNSE